MDLVNSKINYIIESRSLLIRPISINEISQNYLDWLNNKEVNEFLETKKASQESIISYINDLRTQNLELFAVFAKNQEGKHVGNISITSKKNDKGIFGLMIGDEKARGGGAGSESSMCIIKLLFEELGINRLELGARKENKAAVKNLVALNGVKVKEDEKNIYFEILNDDWQNKKGKYFQLLYDKIQIIKF